MHRPRNDGGIDGEFAHDWGFYMTVDTIDSLIISASFSMSSNEIKKFVSIHTAFRRRRPTFAFSFRLLAFSYNYALCIMNYALKKPCAEGDLHLLLALGF
jgi:hypothetical protein